IDKQSQTLDGIPPAGIAASPALMRMKSDFPWPRDVYAFVIDRLAQAGARVIAIDLMFPTSRQGDDAFRDALDRHENKVVIGSDAVPAAGEPKLFRPTRDFDPHSLHEIFLPEIWDSPEYSSGAFFRDKVVIIGPEGAWSKDYINTPRGRIAGPEMHLNAVNA